MQDNICPQEEQGIEHPAALAGKRHPGFGILLSVCCPMAPFLIFCSLPILFSLDMILCAAGLWALPAGLPGSLGAQWEETPLVGKAPAFAFL